MVTIPPTASSISCLSSSDRETITETIAFSSHSEGTQRISLAPLFPSTGKIPESGLFTVTLQPNASRLTLHGTPRDDL